MMKTSSARALLVMVALLIAVLTGSTARADYAVTDIGALKGGRESFGMAINAYGQVAGITYDVLPPGFERGFFYDGKALHSLGEPGLNTGGNVAALSLNRDGLVVGRFFLDVRMPRAFVHDGHAIRDLGTLGGRFAEAWGINDAGLIVGGADDADGRRRAFLYD